MQTRSALSRKERKEGGGDVLEQLRRLVPGGMLLAPEPPGSSWVRVAPSQIAGAGRGLYTVRPFRKGELITFYDGYRLLSHDGASALRQLDPSRVSHLRTLESGRTVIDGFREPLPGTGAASFCNDGRSAARNNARFVTRSPVRSSPLQAVFLQATRNLAVGDEVYVSYGRNYWREAEEERA